MKDRLNKLLKELELFLNYSPIMDDCTDDENQMYADMANLKCSIENVLDSSTSKTVFLTKEECFCGIVQLCDNIAKKMGRHPTDSIRYDCREIHVTIPVQEAVFDFYRNKYGQDDGSIATIWITYGPKANLEGNNYRAVIDEGFIKEIENGD